MGGPGDGGELTLCAPGGEPLAHGRRMTFREARSWVKRSDALLGRWRGPTIEWVPDQKRTAFAAEARQTEGRDCNVAGDVVLYRLTDGRPVIVIEEPYSSDVS
jgi:hypothetical protein